MKPHLPLISRAPGKNSEKHANGVGIDVQRAGLAVATIVILSVLLSIHLFPNKVSLRLYEVAPTDIYAARNARYRDAAETERRKERAGTLVGKVYDPVANAGKQAMDALGGVFSTLENVRQAGTLGASAVSEFRGRIKPLLAARVSDQTLSYLLTTDSAALSDIEDRSAKLLNWAMSKEVRDDAADLRAARRTVMDESRRLIGDRAKARVVGELVQALVRPNRAYNDSRTRRLQEEARGSVQPAYGQIMVGDKIIGKGDTVLEEHIEKFEALGLRHPKTEYQVVISLSLFVLVVVLLVMAYLRRYHPEVYANTRTLALLALLVIISTFALRLGGSMLGIRLSPSQVGYLSILWVATAAMLLSVMVNPQVAVVIASLLSLVLALMLNSELRYVTGALITAFVGIFAVTDIRDRNDLVRAFGLLAGIGVLLVWITGTIENAPADDMLIGSVWATAIAAAATWLFYIGTWLLERPFGRTTHISLLELADTNRPLLKQLVMEAPGTFTHSMLVGHLAEAAADAIGADTLVARVASYYHDIGKMRRPHFFIENQHVENAHDHINPTLSTLVITSHIKDGVEIAKEYRLPKMVQDVITQHHGTSLVQYFYSQFTDEHDPSTALEQQFRYAGPKPQTKEAAIVMLADSLEAASRAMDKPTPAKIELLVNRVISDKLRDGQLDECELTFREISSISSSFVRATVGTMHARIEYPEPAPEGKKAAANADSDSEPAGGAAGPAPGAQPGATAAASGKLPRR